MKYFTALRGILLALTLLSAPIASFAASPAEAAAKSSASATSQKNESGVNINTANVEELASTLAGVGPKLAQAIIDYREANGVFADKAQLMQVKGIGDSVFNKNKAKISL
ncbi:MAG: helix-hairpin-helix domain-containing protein [Porticoccaceae bacterium]